MLFRKSVRAIPLIIPKYHNPTCGVSRTCRRRICSDQSLHTDYMALFDKGYQSVDDLRNQYDEAFGDSFSVVDPTLETLFDQVKASIAVQDFRRFEGICSSDVMANSMTLDKVTRQPPAHHVVLKEGLTRACLADHRFVHLRTAARLLCEQRHGEHGGVFELDRVQTPKSAV